MRRDNWIVTESSTRPAGKPDECFYCNRKVGEQHKEDCVIRSRTVVVNFTISVTLDVPEAWEPEFINFRYNESSWCAGNLVSLLKQRDENIDGCLCEFTKAEYIREANEEDEESWGTTFVNELES